MRLVIAFLLLIPSFVSAEQVASSTIYVVDGDTIDVSGTRIRLLGYDTPETFRAICPEEQRLGEVASIFLSTLIRRHDNVDIYLLQQPDRYGRKLGQLVILGQDVSDIMISANLARPYSGGRRSSWC